MLLHGISEYFKMWKRKTFACIKMCMLINKFHTYVNTNMFLKHLKVCVREMKFIVYFFS